VGRGNEHGKGEHGEGNMVMRIRGSGDGEAVECGEGDMGRTDMFRVFGNVPELSQIPLNISSPSPSPPLLWPLHL
jgi:hypothetical protein